MYQQHNIPAQKNHAHSLDFHTISHNNFPITFNQPNQSTTLNHQHNTNTHNQNSLNSTQPNFSQLTNLFPTPASQPAFQFQPPANNTSFDFNNVFNQPSNQNKANPTHNLTYTKTSASGSFDIFGTSSTSGSNNGINSFQTQSHQPVSMNINMYANNINFNFTPQI